MTLKEEAMAREEIWLQHGCPLSALYGDDGEMQCGICHIDFRRDSISSILERLRDIRFERAKKGLGIAT